MDNAAGETTKMRYMTIKNDHITQHMNYMRRKYLQNNGLITDKDCDKLSLLFFERDKASNLDTEAMAVQRGITQGMKLLRQIIEGHKLEP